MKRRLGVFLLLLTVLLMICGVSGAYFFKVPEKLWEELMPIPDGKRVSVLIEPGMNARQAAGAFAVQGALDGREKQLLYWMRRLGIDRKIRAGRYYVVRSEPWFLARQLKGMRPALLRVTILPGTDIFSLDSLMGYGGDFPSMREALMNDVNYPEEMREILPKDIESRIAFLIPDTYFLVDRNPDELVHFASNAWWKLFGSSADMSPLHDTHSSAVVASMVEREVLHDSECARVAGVIHNRLARNMPLQIDATVVYAWKLKGKRLTRVLNSDLSIDSPYNTYKLPGLPPHPICVPGRAAWEAAISPETNPYYYYVAGKDGFHYFSPTYSGHLSNIKKAREEK